MHASRAYTPQEKGTDLNRSKMLRSLVARQAQLCNQATTEHSACCVDRDLVAGRCVQTTRLVKVCQKKLTVTLYIIRAENYFSGLKHGALDLHKCCGRSAPLMTHIAHCNMLSDGSLYVSSFNRNTPRANSTLFSQMSEDVFQNTTFDTNWRLIDSKYFRKLTSTLDPE